uniref:Uncharacterized protein n=1 Tax=Tanacetum cinerariifolium TaxID=118510 RepID=A0A699GVU0_TANCI|nr:hypothetical protein [Tanacetum cinerariifolium]
MDDEPMWATNCVVALTPGSTITSPETANEFAIKVYAYEVCASEVCDVFLRFVTLRRMILKLGDPDSEVPVAETFHEQTDEELSEKEVKQMEADDQAIQFILMGLPEGIYAAVDSWIQLQAEEFNFMAVVRDLEEIKEVNGNCILMANLEQASTLGTQTDSTPVYDSDG